MGKGGFSENCLMISVIIVNMLCGILGALIFSLAVWMRVENEVKEWISEIGMSQYWTGLYILMAAGLITVIVSFCGCCGALMSNSKLLCTSGIFVFAAIILELAGGIFTIRNGSKNSGITPWLHTTFNELILDSNYNPRSNRILQLIQEKVGCCGSVNYQDYERARLPISDYCRDAVSGNVYQDGCVERFSVFMEKRAGWIGGIAIFCACLQLLLVVFSICHWRNIRDEPQILPQNKRYDPVPTSS